MHIQRINSDTFVGPQIALSDIENIKDVGICSIIVTRPDGESDDQPSFATVENAAAEASLAAYQIPVIPGQITDDQVRLFGSLTASLPKPIFAYCRSGARATMLWALNEAANGRSVDEILEATKATGHDLSALVPRLSSIAS